jgi:hypothetical protein
VAKDSDQIYRDQFRKPLAGRYLRKQYHCPFCGSKEIEVRPIDEDEIPTMSRNMVCSVCHQWWIETYVLSAIEPAEQCCVHCGEILQKGEHVVHVTDEVGQLGHINCDDPKRRE